MALLARSLNSRWCWTGTDNVVVREQLNRLCRQQQVPLVSGAAIRMEGQISVFSWQPGTPCYRCISRLFGEQILSCVEAGVKAPLVGVIGAMQAMEAIKVLTSFGAPATSRLLMYDAMSAEFRSMKVAQDVHCEVCVYGIQRISSHCSSLLS